MYVLVFLLHSLARMLMKPVYHLRTLSLYEEPRRNRNEYKQAGLRTLPANPADHSGLLYMLINLTAIVDHV